jgi:hypothetical protein
MGYVCVDKVEVEWQERKRINIYQSSIFDFHGFLDENLPSFFSGMKEDLESRQNITKQRNTAAALVKQHVRSV